MDNNLKNEFKIFCIENNTNCSEVVGAIVYNLVHQSKGRKKLMKLVKV